MTDYTRPNSQWTDLPDSDTGGPVPYSLGYVATTGVVTFLEIPPRRMHAGFVTEGDEVQPYGTVRVYQLTEDVNGQLEAPVLLVANEIVIYLD